MNFEPEANERKAAEKASFRAALKSLPQRLWKMLMHHLPWKLLALFLAVCLWAGLITQDPTLTRERTFADVPVTITGADTLQRNGLIVLANFTAAPVTVRLSADVPQREYNTVTAANYNPRIDLSKITQAGPQTLRISTTSTVTYGTVNQLSPDSVEVTVDEYIMSYRVPVSVQRTGQFPKGFYGPSPALDPGSVSVSGPKSIITRIARIMVDLDVSRLPAQTGLIRTALPMRFEDKDGNEIQSDFIDVTNAGVLLRSIVVEQTLYATKTLPISSLSLTQGVPAQGYEVKSVSATPNIVVAAGEDAGLEALDSLFLEQPVDVTGREESFSVQMKVRKPSELVYLSTDSINLHVEIAPVISTREFTNVKLSFTDRSAHRTTHCDTKTVSLTLTGPAMLLNNLKASALTAYVDTSDLPAGEYELPILLKISGVDERDFTYVITPKNAIFRVEVDE
ncbi:MAG: CdaR family protein [Candidatus Limiplasma sp.]|nr:CdaR family protein [Candidatus Limiplasma sp.]